MASFGSPKKAIALLKGEKERLNGTVREQAVLLYQVRGRLSEAERELGAWPEKLRGAVEEARNKAVAETRAIWQNYVSELRKRLEERLKAKEALGLQRVDIAERAWKNHRAHYKAVIEDLETRLASQTTAEAQAPSTGALDYAEALEGRTAAEEKVKTLEEEMGSLKKEREELEIFLKEAEERFLQDQEVIAQLKAEMAASQASARNSMPTISITQTRPTNEGLLPHDVPEELNRSFDEEDLAEDGANETNENSSPASDKALSSEASLTFGNFDSD